jgi:NADH-quinone oxidoreductase E subunit
MSNTQADVIISSSDHKELLVKLQELQDRFGCLSREHLVELAEVLSLPLSEVYGVATFYSFLATRPQGRHIIRICRSVPCYLQHSETAIETIEKELGIKPGQTSADGRFSLELVNCIGACDKAPAMLVNHDVHGELTPAKIATILKSYE